MPNIPEENKRTGSIRIRLSLEMLERLEALAKRYGMPVSTLSAFAVARFVQSEEMTRTLAMDATRHQVKTIGEQLTDDRMERLFGPMFESMFSVFQSAQLTEGGGKDEASKKGG